MCRRVARMQHLAQRGFTLFEFAIVLILLAILLGTLTERLHFYQGEAENAEVESLLQNLRAHLNSYVLQGEVRGDSALAAQFVNKNPMEWLERLPGNYIGELDTIEMQNVEPGNWYFDRAHNTLVYMFRSRKSFLDDVHERRFFRVEFRRLPKDTAKPEGAPRNANGVALIQVDEP